MQAVRKRLEVDERREQLLELALEMFGSRTYDEISIDEIAKAAGISKGLLYHYFPSKRAFYVAALQTASQQLIDETDVGDELPMGPERMQRALRAFVHYVDNHRIPFSALLRGGVGSDPEVRRIVGDTRQRLVDRIRTRFPPPADDPKTLAVLNGWLGFIEAASLRWIEEDDMTTDELCNLLVGVGVVIFSSLGVFAAR